VKDRRGAVARATGLAESVAAAVRRRQQSRLPRVLLYDPAGEPSVLRSGTVDHDEVLFIADGLVAVALEDQPDVGVADDLLEDEL
jgi:hypothetical protein